MLYTSITTNYDTRIISLLLINYSIQNVILERSVIVQKTRKRNIRILHGILIITIKRTCKIQVYRCNRCRVSASARPGDCNCFRKLLPLKCIYNATRHHICDKAETDGPKTRNRKKKRLFFMYVFSHLAARYLYMLTRIRRLIFMVCIITLFV